MRVSRIVGLLSMALLFAAPARALESAPVRSARATVTLVSESDAVAAGRPVRIGLRLRLAPGWHTYWQNPGDAGAAPDVPLTLSEGAAAGPIAWPVPERMAESGVATYGYVGDLLLPVAITPGAGPLHVATHASWLVCKEICVPEEGDFALDLPPGAPAPSAEAPLFAAADLRTPRPSPFEAGIAPDGTLRVSGEALAGAVSDAWLLPLEPGAIGGGAQRFSARPNGFSLTLPKGEAFRPDARLAGVLVVVDKSGRRSAFDVSAAPVAAEAVLAQLPLGRMLAFALLGGLLLNLMPCVFPVLAMKAMALRAGASRRGAVFYTAGVLAAFSALGAALLAARAGGSAAGWGFQFQSPGFVAATAWVLFAVGLNMSGVFELSAGRLAGAGQGFSARGGASGSFFTGLLAVVVAAPCTAPFMGAAVAGALAAPWPVAMAVFLAMGLGLAAPYAALAAAPALGRALPRPGRWMDVLRQALAFPMYAAAAWLVWVASIQSGPAGVLATLAGLTLVGFSAWALGLGATLGRAGRRVSRAAAAAAVVAALALLPGLASDRAGPQTEAGVEPYSAARLAELRAEGRPVFVNLTAAWCVTCLVNERVALSPEPVRKAFAERRVAYLKGDWTRQDEAVTSLLRQNDRAGVPLYLYYSPGAARPAVLPQILTQAEVLEAVGRL
jgi:thiol:disulfide interchange protein DsbD